MISESAGSSWAINEWKTDTWKMGRNAQRICKFKSNTPELNYSKGSDLSIIGVRRANILPQNNKTVVFYTFIIYSFIIYCFKHPKIGSVSYHLVCKFAMLLHLSCSNGAFIRMIRAHTIRLIWQTPNPHRYPFGHLWTESSRGRGVLPMMGYTGKLHQKRGPFFNSGIRKGVGKGYFWYLKGSPKH